MSDILKKLVNSVKQKIYLSTEHCVNNSKKASVNNSAIALTIRVSYEHLKRWYDWKEKGVLDRHCMYESSCDRHMNDEIYKTFQFISHVQ